MDLHLWEIVVVGFYMFGEIARMLVQAMAAHPLETALCVVVGIPIGALLALQPREA